MLPEDVVIHLPCLENFVPADVLEEAIRTTRVWLEDRSEENRIPQHDAIDAVTQAVSVGDANSDEKFARIYKV